MDRLELERGMGGRPRGRPALVMGVVVCVVLRDCDLSGEDLMGGCLRERSLRGRKSSVATSRKYETGRCLFLSGRFSTDDAKA